MASTAVDDAMIPRRPKTPTRTEVPAGRCPAVSATAAASVAPAAARASMRGLARPQSCTSQLQAAIPIAAAWALQTKLRVDRWDTCASSGLDDSLRTDVKSPFEKQIKIPPGFIGAPLCCDLRMILPHRPS
eukprot:9032322-Pyramimonas_sp.AAC.1